MNTNFSPKENTAMNTATSNKSYNQQVANAIKSCIDTGDGILLSLTDFENRFKYNKFYIDSCFTSCFGISLIAYRNIKRMEVGRELLRANHSVTAVAERVGYKSLYAFSRAYKKVYGASPTKDMQQFE